MPTTAVPTLRVRDVERSLAWWVRLGFTEVFRHRFEGTQPWFVGIGREDARVYLSEHAGDAPGPALLHLWVDDVDRVAAELGVPVEQVPWGRECEVADPDGNRVRVATAS